MNAYKGSFFFLQFIIDR